MTGPSGGVAAPVAERRFARALLASAGAAGCAARIMSAAYVDWCSATFTGARHILRLSLPDPSEASAWIDALPEAEFRLPGLLVADLVVHRDGAEAEVEALILRAD